MFVTFTNKIKCIYYFRYRKINLLINHTIIETTQYKFDFLITCVMLQ